MIGYILPIKVKSKDNSKIVMDATAVYSIVLKNNKPYIYDKKYYLNHNINTIHDKIGATGYVFGPNSTSFDYRQNIINNYTSKSNSNIKIINIDDIKTINLTLNDNISTISKLYAFLRGSNTTGSKGDLKRTPILLADNEYYNYRFIHILNTIKKNTKLKSEIHREEYITFDEFLNLCNLRSTFEIFNKDIISINESTPLSSEWIKELGSVGFKTTLTSKEIHEFNKELFKKSDRIKLRSNILSKTNQLKYWNLSERFVEAAHIVDVRFLEKDIDGYYTSDIVNQDNGILLPNVVHGDFDKYKFTITPDGKFIYKKQYKNHIEELNDNFNILSIDFKSMIEEQPGMKYFLEKRLKTYYKN